MVEALLRFESTSGGRLVATDTELWFGGWEGVDIGGLVVRGKIDRVDADPQGTVLFVIDYKTGSIPSFSEIGTEKGLQLPLYLLALAAKRPKARVIGGAYLSLKDMARSRGLEFAPYPVEDHRRGCDRSPRQAIAGLPAAGRRCRRETPWGRLGHRYQGGL